MVELNDLVLPVMPVPVTKLLTRPSRARGPVELPGSALPPTGELAPGEKGLTCAALATVWPRNRCVTGSYHRVPCRYNWVESPSHMRLFHRTRFVSPTDP